MMTFTCEILPGMYEIEVPGELQEDFREKQRVANEAIASDSDTEDVDVKLERCNLIFAANDAREKIALWIAERVVEKIGQSAAIAVEAEKWWFVTVREAEIGERVIPWDKIFEVNFPLPEGVGSVSDELRKCPEEWKLRFEKGGGDRCFYLKPGEVVVSFWGLE
ncbi:MAG: hypothetical protein AAFY20_18965 [Cyanobacteria bacterium J06639_14]